MKITFEIKGDPTGKGRPRFARRGAFTTTYTPQKTLDYEEVVQQSYISAGGRMFGKEPLCLTLQAFYGVPKSFTKLQRSEALSGNLTPLKKPDIDNILKIVCDALNGVAYADDVQIAEAHMKKYYDSNPRVAVSIENKEGEKAGE